MKQRGQQRHVLMIFYLFIVIYFILSISSFDSPNFFQFVGSPAIQSRYENPRPDPSISSLVVSSPTLPDSHALPMHRASSQQPYPGFNIT